MKRLKRTYRNFFGRVDRIPPRKGGALGCCVFCSWSRFYSDRVYGKSAVQRVASALRNHARRVHHDLFLKVDRFDDGVPL